MIGIVWQAVKVVYERYGHYIIIQGLIYGWDAIAKRKKPK